MEEARIQSKRIAKNTVYMYIRMFITLLIGLYTSRVVLASLGFDDYGLYNVVGGIIAMFGFLNGALSQTTSRYITFYLGKDDDNRLREVFSTSFYIHVLLALIIAALGETVGLWYVQNKLVIPDGRYVAAMWLYQFTVITAAVNIISVPFNASIISHEKFSVYALVAVVESVMKLVIALLLSCAPFDRLIFYGVLLLLLQIAYNAFGWIYSVNRFKGIRIIKILDRRLLKEMFGFSGWNLFGTFSYVFFTQGVNLMLNFFCGTAVNAARGIAVQVESVVRNFATNVQSTMNPQIIKSYAQSDKQRMFSLVFASSRYCFFLFWLIALPIILEAEYLLKIWLGDYPEHTVNFLRITLLNVTLESLVTPLYMSNLASGKLKMYQICMCVISTVFIPATYIAIKLTRIPESVFLCILALSIVEMVARVIIVHRQVGLPRMEYVRKVILTVLAVSAAGSAVPVLIHFNMGTGLARLLIVGSICVLSMGLSVYFIGIDNNERGIVKAFVRQRFSKTDVS